MHPPKETGNKRRLKPFIIRVAATRWLGKRKALQKQRKGCPPPRVRHRGEARGSQTAPSSYLQMSDATFKPILYWWNAWLQLSVHESRGIE